MSDTEQKIVCEKCGSDKVETTIWEMPNRYYSHEMRKTLSKYDLNQVRVHTCNECGHEMRRC